MKMFEGFDVKISEDGRRMVGCKIAKTPDKEAAFASSTKSNGTSVVKAKAETEPDFKIIEFTAKDKTRREEILDAKTRLVGITGEISAMDNLIRDYSRSEKNSKRKCIKWNRFKPYYVIASGILGFFVGLAYGIYETLYAFSATTAISFSSIIGTTAICFAIGAIGALLLAGISCAHSSIVIKRHKKNSSHAHATLERLQASKKFYREEQNRLTDLICRQNCCL